MKKIVVIGAGTSGCIVAARLTQDAINHVTLVEAGPDRPLEEVPKLTSVNWIHALQENDAFYHDLFATKLEHGVPRPYSRGTGVGGSATTNAMLALPGLPEDYQAWAEEFGLDKWRWDQVKPWFDRLKNDLVISTDAELTPVDRALIDSAHVFDLPTDIDTFEPTGGSGRLWRNASGGKRYSSREVYLEPARSRDNLKIHSGSKVRRLLWSGELVNGIELADGQIIDADHVVLCAGTFETPAILLRSEINLSGVGSGLQDHPAASVYFSMKSEYQQADESLPAIGALLRCSSSVGKNDINLLPLHGSLLPSGPANHGLLMAALMRVESTGYLELDPQDPMKPPIVFERMLSSKNDLQAMKDAVRAIERTLEAPSFQQIIDEVFVDELGTSIDMLRDEEYFQHWLSNYIGDYFHAVGTARMGNDGDEAAVVDQQGKIHGLQNAYVFDASIMPLVPSGNSNLPTAMIAERLSLALRHKLLDLKAYT